MLISYGHIAGYNTLNTITYVKDKPHSTNIATESSIIATKRKIVCKISILEHIRLRYNYSVA